MDINLNNNSLNYLNIIIDTTQLDLAEYERFYDQFIYLLNNELKFNEEEATNRLIIQKNSIISILRNIIDISLNLKNKYQALTSLRPTGIDLNIFDNNTYFSKDLAIRVHDLIFNLIDKYGKLNLINKSRKEIKHEEESLRNSIHEIVVEVIKINLNIESTSSENLQSLKISSNEIGDYLNNQNKKIKDEMATRFQEETSLILKQFDYEISNLTNKFENQIKNLTLDQEKTIKSSELLSKNIGSSLKELANLNDRTQKIELEFSKIIGSETDKIKLELEEAKNTLSDQIDSIITNLKEKSYAIENLHTDFKNLVEKAGIYELTKNYETKSTEEKAEYKQYRNYTSYSILAAIFSTILVFIVAFTEHYYAENDAPTNYLLLASRLSISLMFFVLALYLSKQASKHYECYQENHRTFLQLAALEPFMARMTPEEQKEIRKGLIPSYFNQANDGKYASKGDEVDLSSNMTNIFNKLIEKIPSKSEEPDPKKTENTPG